MTSAYSNIRLIVGLGNPGSQYAQTRHNMGFMAIDALCEKMTNVQAFEKSCSGQMSQFQFRGQAVKVLKPQTFMNLSGDSVAQACSLFKFNPNEILIVYDDLDLPLGTLRLRSKGSGGGHNGMNHVIERLGTANVPRLRLGIGRAHAQGQYVDYVLEPFTSDEQSLLQTALSDAVSALKLALSRGLNMAMNHYNRVVPTPLTADASAPTFNLTLNPISGGPNHE